ncbi:MAG: hypothetical protein EVG15_01075 [Candidatus Acididesulfobacter diazotrophicus]|uniref:Uncharacterized protein n=1 Tax=Candidatus Acididesulfobacter diazotrophicus TaxID=2597226 RepID=A0A519BQF4_9DELT|nr:MAG: hypothetical protein EVG15_01075 [Candidatus Acididesulfobacter diazotrophicus]
MAEYNKRVKLTISLKSPVVMTDVPGDQNMAETKLYLTGTSIIGLFANKYIKKNKSADNLFYEFFLRGGLIFSNAFKGIESDGGVLPSYQLPLSIQKKKHDESGQCIEYFMQSCEDGKSGSDKMKNKFQPVRKFGRILKDGFIKTVSVDTGVSFHGAINNDKKDNEIFNYEWICPFQTFISYIIGNEENLRSFLNFISEISEPSGDGKLKILKAYLGRSRTAQYGYAELRISGMEDIAGNTDNDKYFMLENDKVCIMTMLSDAIVYNDKGFSTADISDLEKALGSDVKIIKSAIRKGTAENFVGKWAARKPMENVFLAGSSFLIKYDTLPENFRDFEIYGIGERTNEGFGTVSFNLNIKKDLEIKNDEIGGTLKRDKCVNATNIAKNVIKDKIINVIKDELVISAIEKAQGSDKNGIISGALSGKLREFAKGMRNLRNFNDKLEKLRKTAKDKIKDAYTGEESLYDFLEKFKDGKHIDEKIKKIYEDEKYGISKFMKKFNFLNINDILMEDCLIMFQKIYLVNFFTQLKRKNKKKTGGGKNGKE